MDALDALFNLAYFNEVSPFAFGGMVFGFVLAFVPWLVGAFFRIIHKFFE